MLSATILPVSSEVLFIGAIESLGMNPWQAFTIASVGNCIGCCINYAIGRFGSGWVMTKLGIKDEKLERWHARFEKYDRWLWAANWIPVVGDPITIYAGIIKLDFREFLAWVVVLRTTRYLLMILFWDFFTG